MGEKTDHRGIFGSHSSKFSVKQRFGDEFLKHVKNPRPLNEIRKQI